MDYTENRFKVEQIFHKLGIIVAIVSDKMPDAYCCVETNKYIQSILDKMKKDKHEPELQYNFIFNKIGNIYNGKRVTFNECMYEFKQLFCNPSDNHVKFLELFCEGFPQYVNQK